MTSKKAALYSRYFTRSNRLLQLSCNQSCLITVQIYPTYKGENLFQSEEIKTTNFTIKVTTKSNKSRVILTPVLYKSPIWYRKQIGSQVQSPFCPVCEYSCKFLYKNKKDWFQKSSVKNCKHHNFIVQWSHYATLVSVKHYLIHQLFHQYLVSPFEIKSVRP